jgi:hypothetical protein
MVSSIMKVEISPPTTSNATFHVNPILPVSTNVVVMYRFDNEMIFEEKLPNSRTQSDPAAVVVEKDSKC